MTETTAPAPLPAVMCVSPGSFEPQKHYYPKVLNSHVHPLVHYFFGLSNSQIAERYCHLHPSVTREAVLAVLTHRPRWFRWGGCDLFHAVREHGQRQILVIETNSCPSGQKSMPLLEEREERAGYHELLRRAFVPMLRRRSLPEGGLAVLWDKNAMENSGYAATLADLTGEQVWLVRAHASDDGYRFTEDRVLEIRTDSGEWIPIRAAFRYVTQAPWNRIPVVTRTALFNPVLACLAGGRNKMLAAKAYEFHNARLQPTGLKITVPETIWDVARQEVPLWVQKMGGVAVIKNPYSNAGQGVYTVTSQAELDVFMASEQHYDRFIVQALIGNAEWSSRGKGGRLYHVGTMPGKKGGIYVADLRFMVGVGEEGFFPVACYARRARRPMPTNLTPDAGSSWDILGTNLSVKQADGSWTTQSERLMLVDSRDFNRLGVALDDLVDGYIQTVLSVTAIDEMAQQLLTKKGVFRRRFFASINPDARLNSELVT